MQSFGSGSAETGLPSRALIPLPRAHSCGPTGLSAVLGEQACGAGQSFCSVGLSLLWGLCESMTSHLLKSRAFSFISLRAEDPAPCVWGPVGLWVGWSLCSGWGRGTSWFTDHQGGSHGGWRRAGESEELGGPMVFCLESGDSSPPGWLC